MIAKLIVVKTDWFGNVQAILLYQKILFINLAITITNFLLCFVCLHINKTKWICPICNREISKSMKFVNNHYYPSHFCISWTWKIKNTSVGLASILYIRAVQLGTCRCHGAFWRISWHPFKRFLFFAFLNIKSI